MMVQASNIICANVSNKQTSNKRPTADERAERSIETQINHYTELEIRYSSAYVSITFHSSSVPRPSMSISIGMCGLQCKIWQH